MPTIHATLRFAGGRVKGLSPAVDPDEPLRKGEAASAGGGEPGEPGEQGPPGRSFYERRIQQVPAASGVVECNWALYDEIRLTLTGNATLVFNGANDGQGCTLKVAQDATGGRTLALPSNVRYSADITAYAATVGAGKKDRIGFIRDGDDSMYDFVSVIKGF